MIITATGHRIEKLGNDLDTTTHLLMKFADETIVKYLDMYENITTFYCGMQSGWDLAIASAILNYSEIEIIAAIPFKGFKPSGGKQWEKLFDHVVKEAKQAVIVSEGGYAVWKLMQRNKYMVDRSDLVTALWDGSKSGTSNCVAYAGLRNKQVDNLWNDFENFNERIGVQEAERMIGQ